MKLIRQNMFIVLLVLSSLMAELVFGDCKVDWHTIDGGGGASNGGQYIVRGTIGQPDAVYSQGGDYEVLGGFWPAEPLCFVEFEDFARFAEHWLYTGSDIPADLDGDHDVDFDDLESFTYEWLYWCPYDWSLK